MSEPLRVFIGYDRNEDAAYRVNEASLLDHATVPVSITKLDVEALHYSGLYRRPYWVEDGQKYDAVDGKPMSTEFSFSRFLVPAASLWQGWSLFVDSDFLWRDDVGELFAMADPGKAVQVVKHERPPSGEEKMRGGYQNPAYARKNWSSLMLFNNEHEATRMLTTWHVNHLYGNRLHQFSWVPDELIGSLPPEWNYLESNNPPPQGMDPRAVHFTLGTPDIPQYANSPYAGEWLAWWGSLTGEPNAA